MSPSHKSVRFEYAVACTRICISEWPINFRLVNVHAYSIIQKHILSKKPVHSFARLLCSIERNTRFGLLKFIFCCKENTKPQFDRIKTIEFGLNGLSISNAHYSRFWELVPHLLNHSRCFTWVIPIMAVRTKMMYFMNSAGDWTQRWKFTCHNF